MAASRVLRNLVMMLGEKGEVLENTQRQLRQKRAGVGRIKRSMFSSSTGKQEPSLYNPLSKLSSLLGQQETRRHRRRVQSSQLYRCGRAA